MHWDVFSIKLHGGGSCCVCTTSHLQWRCCQQDRSPLHHEQPEPRWWFCACSKRRDEEVVCIYQCASTLCLAGLCLSMLCTSTRSPLSTARNRLSAFISLLLLLLHNIFHDVLDALHTNVRAAFWPERKIISGMRWEIGPGWYYYWSLISISSSRELCLIDLIENCNKNEVKRSSINIFIVDDGRVLIHYVFPFNSLSLLVCWSKYTQSQQYPSPWALTWHSKERERR